MVSLKWLWRGVICSWTCCPAWNLICSMAAICSVADSCRPSGVIPVRTCCIAVWKDRRIPLAAALMV